MKLETLNIRRISYGDMKGQYEVSVEFSTKEKDEKHKTNRVYFDHDTIKMHINPNLHDKFIKQCSVAIQEALETTKCEFFETLEKLGE